MVGKTLLKLGVGGLVGGVAAKTFDKMFSILGIDETFLGKIGVKITDFMIWSFCTGTVIKVIDGVSNFINKKKEEPVEKTEEMNDAWSEYIKNLRETILENFNKNMGVNGNYFDGSENLDI